MVCIRCCYKCKDREVGCHSICERYLKEKEKAEILRNENLKRSELFIKKRGKTWTLK